MATLPNAITLALLVHSRYSPEPFVKESTASAAEAAAFLLRHGLIGLDPRKPGPNPEFSTYSLTDKGFFMLDHLLAQPLPVEVSTPRWEIPS